MPKFDPFTINGYTRREAALMSFPKVKRIDMEELKFTEDLTSLNVVDIFSSTYLPPHSDLLVWRSRLRSIDKDRNAYIASDHGNFLLDTVDNAIKLHNAKTIRDCVDQETIWFRNPPKRPHSVSEYPKESLLDRFQDLTLNTPSNRFIGNLSMKPGELAGLAHTRYLSSDHVEWFTKKLNIEQKHSLCVYLNGVRDVENYLSQHFDQQINISFILNVGKHRDGHVFLGNDLHVQVVTGPLPTTIK